MMQAGFRLERVVSTLEPMSILEAVPQVLKTHQNEGRIGAAAFRRVIAGKINLLGAQQYYVAEKSLKPQLVLVK